MAGNGSRNVEKGRENSNRRVATAKDEKEKTRQRRRGDPHAGRLTPYGALSCSTEAAKNSPLLVFGRASEQAPAESSCAQ